MGWLVPGREGAVKVQLVDRIVTRMVERVERVPHPPAECVTMVLADPVLTRKVLIGLSQQIGSKQITPADDAFWDLATSTESSPKRSPAPPTVPTPAPEPEPDRPHPRASCNRSCPHIWHREARSVASPTKLPRASPLDLPDVRPPLVARSVKGDRGRRRRAPDRVDRVECVHRRDTN